jgi:hypothetical protein
MGNPFKNLAKMQYAQAISVLLVAPVYYVSNYMMEFDSFIVAILCIVTYVAVSLIIIYFVSRS